MRLDSPDDGELLAYLDGELTAERQAEIRHLLASDWRLRVRLGELERDIETYVNATHPQRQGELPPFDEIWRNVTSRLTEPLEPLPVESELRLLKRREESLAARFSGWVAALSQQPARLRGVVAALLALVVTGLSLWWFSSDQLRAVSAEELIQRATQAEAAHSRQIADPVVYRRIQVKRAGKAETVAWESWRGVEKNQIRQRVADERGWRFLRANEAAPPLIAELIAVLQANHLDAQRPLSAAAYAAWRKAVRIKTETVRELSLSAHAVNDGLMLTTTTREPYAVNAIIEASLIVRKSDWRVVAEHLKAQGENEIREYELSETGYEVLPLHALTVFADLASTPEPVILPAPSRVPIAPPTPSPTLPPTLSPTVAAPTAAVLQEAEIAALYALHQLKADLGEQLEIAREARGVVVRGLVETEARKRQLSEALRDLPLVTAQIQTVAEAASPAAQQSPAQAVVPVNESAAAVAAGAPSVNAFEQRLAKYFAEREAADRRAIDRKVAQLSNDVLTESSAALSEAWALRRLLERYAAESDLSPALSQRIAEMRANHIARLRAQSRRLRSLLEPLLLAIAGARAAAPPADAQAEATKQAQAVALLRAVESAQQLTHRLFGGAGSTTPEESARQLLAALARLDQTLRHLEQMNSR